MSRRSRGTARGAKVERGGSVGYTTQVKIRNWAALAITEQRSRALAIAEAGLEAIDTAAAVRATVRVSGDLLLVHEHAVPLRGCRRVLLVGVGKCATAAAAELVAILGARLDGGVVLDVGESAAQDLGAVRRFAGTHPMPSDHNVAAAREIVALLQQAGPDDLVLCVVSGGGSTLLCLPPDGATVDSERAVLQALFRAGATIEEINTLRKHTSLARGGFLAAHAHPARVVSLVFSDVPGNRLDIIASGPTVMDPSTVADAQGILAKYGVAAASETGRCVLVETPKDPDIFERVHDALVVSNDVALEAMAAEARAQGYAPTVVTTTLTGEAREVGEQVVRALHAAPVRGALLYGGETTVTITGTGRGGRNLELALSALRLTREEELVLTVASDGRDNGDFAGAVADPAGRARAAALGLDPHNHLARNDSYTFFERTGDALLTGATGSNVADLVLAVRG